MKAFYALSLFLVGCETGYVSDYPAVTQGYVEAPAYSQLPEYHAGYISRPVGSGGVGGYGYSGYGGNIMVTNPVGGPVGGTMISGY